MIKEGDKIPVFTAKTAEGKDFNSVTELNGKVVVIYFYPKDDTPGCTLQACSFRDQYEDFTDLGAEVIGISSDSAVSHRAFSEKYQLPFTLLSDHDKNIRKQFGVPAALFGLLPGRVTYVVDKNGIVQLVFDSIFAGKHLQKALEAVKKLM